jgi:anti-anti-sigma factor
MSPADVVLVEAAADFTHVAVRGKLDPDGAAAVELPLTTQTVARRKPAIVDLTEVELITSIGIGVLVTIAKSMRAHHLRMAVVAKAPVRGVLELVALGPMFAIVGTRDEALAALRTP